MKQVKSSHSRLDEQLQKAEAGALLFPSDYFEIGSPESIHMAFSRLSKDNIITRIAKGIYLKPQVHPALGQILPSLEEIAHKIADKEKVIIRPTGSYALNKLGLSTQVPTKVVYLTNGSPRLIKIGKGAITFKSTTPKKLAAKNEMVFLAIQALIELGDNELSSKNFSQLYNVLKKVPPSEIRMDARLAPTYVAKILYLIANKIEHHDPIPTPPNQSTSADH